MNLFLRRGFEAVTIEEICDAADVARATFFLHFAGKESLLTEYGIRANQALAELISASHGSATATLEGRFENARRARDAAARCGQAARPRTPLASSDVR